MKKLVLCVALMCTLAGFTLNAQTPSKDEQEIRALEDRFTAAVKAKDLDGIMKVYAPGNELLVFDLTPPRQYVGWDAYKKDWQDALAIWTGTIKFDVTDLSITADGKLGYSHSIQRVALTGADGKAQEIVVRVTDCYKKIDGKWLIVLEHVSVPIDLTTGKPDLLSKP